MRKFTKTFTAVAALAASLAIPPALYAQDSGQSGESGATMNGGMMGRNGSNGTMGQDGMAGMMSQMNEMMGTCNKMMQAMMEDSGKGTSGDPKDATPQDDG